MAGNIDTRTEVIPASGVVNLGNANFLFVVSASGNVTFKMKRTGLSRGAAQENYTGQLAGLQISRRQRWDFCDLTGTPGVSVTFMYGIADVNEDVTLFNQSIATISGVTATAESPSATIATAAAQVVANTNKVSIAQNLARRRITVCNPSPLSVVTNGGPVFIQVPGAGAGIGYELQSGNSVELRTTAAFDIRNDSGAAVTITTFEES